MLYEVGPKEAPAEVDSVVLGWMNSCINHSWSWFKWQQIQMYGQRWLCFFVALPAKKNPCAFIDCSSQIRLGTGLLCPTSYSYVSRNAMSSILKANLILCPFSTTDDHQFIQSRSRAFPALWKFIMKYKLRGQIISENDQVTFVHNYSHWKQLAQTTIEPQNYCNDSSLTDKWRHPIATEPGEFLSFQLALARVGPKSLNALLKMTLLNLRT